MSDTTTGETMSIIELLTTGPKNHGLDLYHEWRGYGYPMHEAMRRAKADEQPTLWEGVTADYCERILRSIENREKYQQRSWEGRG